MGKVSIDIVFFKNEFLRMSVPLSRTMDLDALQIFKAVVDFGGVTRAAAQLHRVPSNVTTRLKQLEEGLGTKLFHRHSRKLLLSSDWRLVLAYAEQLLRLSAEAELALRSGKPRGKLRIGTLESPAAARLPPVLARYHRANPEVQIELVTGTTGALLEQVSRYAIEAAFVAERFEPDGFEMMPVFREKLVVIAPKEITAIKKPGDIRGMTVIAFGAGCSYRRTLEEWLACSKVTPERSSPASLRVLELLWYPIRSFTRCTRSTRSAFCRYRLRLQMPRRFLSGPENIVLLLSTLYVANWLRRTSAKHFAEVFARCLWPQHGPRAPLLLTASWQKPARSR